MNFSAMLAAKTAHIRMIASGEWLPVPEWEDLYAVSDLGDVQSLRSGSLMKPQLHRKGYLLVKLSCNGTAKTKKIHTLVAAAFLGSCPDGQQVRHGDGDKTNNARTNLSYGTPGENMLDQVRQGVHAEARRNTCDNGHEYTAENTRLAKNGARICKACQAERTQRWRDNDIEQIRLRNRDRMRQARALKRSKAAR